MLSKRLVSICLSFSLFAAIGFVACQSSHSGPDSAPAATSAEALRRGIVLSDFNRFIVQTLGTKPAIGTRYWIFSNVKCRGCFNVLADIGRFYQPGDIFIVEARVAHYMPTTKPVRPPVQRAVHVVSFDINQFDFDVVKPSIVHLAPDSTLVVEAMPL